MAYATTAKRKTATVAKSWDWDSAFRKDDAAREKEVSDAARRFRKAAITK
uniref:Uncharacterized protein n=1 Tax=Pseudomonas phage HRDY3 TaxID=3236930 RepID=A0AB39CE70_9VIRU